jgi:hypothetical protein
LVSLRGRSIFQGVANEYCRQLAQYAEVQQQKYSTNVMIVDDEPDTVFTYKYILSAEGYM